MLTQPESKPVQVQGEHIDIPAMSSISGNVAMHTDTGRTLWANSSILVFLMAASLPIVPMALLVMLLRQPNSAAEGLTWLWIAMAFITEAIAFLTAYGLVRSVLEAEA